MAHHQTGQRWVLAAVLEGSLGLEVPAGVSRAKSTMYYHLRYQSGVQLFQTSEVRMYGICCPTLQLTYRRTWKLHWASCKLCLKPGKLCIEAGHASTLYIKTGRVCCSIFWWFRFSIEGEQLPWGYSLELMSTSVSM